MKHTVNRSQIGCFSGHNVHNTAWNSLKTAMMTFFFARLLYFYRCLIAYYIYLIKNALLIFIVWYLVLQSFCAYSKATDRCSPTCLLERVEPRKGQIAMKSASKCLPNKHQHILSNYFDSTQYITRKPLSIDFSDNFVRIISLLLSIKNKCPRALIKLGSQTQMN